MDVAVPKIPAVGNAIGKSMLPDLVAPPADQPGLSVYPPWVQDGNDADQDDTEQYFMILDEKTKCRPGAGNRIYLEIRT